MDTIKKFNFLSWYGIVATFVVTALFDYQFYDYVMKFGGWEMWQANNYLWERAIIALFIWHAFAVLVLWLIWISNKE